MTREAKMTEHQRRLQVFYALREQQRDMALNSKTNTPQVDLESVSIVSEKGRNERTRLTLANNGKIKIEILPSPSHSPLTHGPHFRPTLITVATKSSTTTTPVRAIDEHTESSGKQIHPRRQAENIESESTMTQEAHKTQAAFIGIDLTRFRNFYAKKLIKTPHLQPLIDVYNDLRIRDQVCQGGMARPIPEGENWATWQRMGTTNPEAHAFFDMSQLPYCERFNFDDEPITLDGGCEDDEQEIRELDSDADTVTAGDLEQTPRKADGFDPHFWRHDDHESELGTELEMQMIKEVRIPAYLFDERELAWRKELLSKYEAAKGFDEVDDDTFFPAGNPMYKPRPDFSELITPVRSRTSTPISDIHRQAITSSVRNNPTFNLDIHSVTNNRYGGGWLGQYAYTSLYTLPPAPSTWSQPDTMSINHSMFGNYSDPNAPKRASSINARAPTFTPASQRTTAPFEYESLATFPGLDLQAIKHGMSGSPQQMHMSNDNYSQTLISNASRRSESRFFPIPTQPKHFFKKQQAGRHTHVPMTQLPNIHHTPRERAHEQPAMTFSRPASSHSGSSFGSRNLFNTDDFQINNHSARVDLQSAPSWGDSLSTNDASWSMSGLDTGSG